MPLGLRRQQRGRHRLSSAATSEAAAVTGAALGHVRGWTGLWLREAARLASAAKGSEAAVRLDEDEASCLCDAPHTRLGKCQSSLSKRTSAAQSGRVATAPQTRCRAPCPPCRSGRLAAPRIPRGHCSNVPNGTGSGTGTHGGDGLELQQSPCVSRARRQEAGGREGGEGWPRPRKGRGSAEGHASSSSGRRNREDRRRRPGPRVVGSAGVRLIVSCLGPAPCAGAGPAAGGRSEWPAAAARAGEAASGEMHGRRGRGGSRARRSF